MTKDEQLVRREEWRQKITEFLESGQSATAWCKTQGVKPHLFYYYLKLFRSPKNASSPTPSQWLPVMLSDRQPCHLLVRLGKATIEIQPGFDTDLLTEVVRALTTVC